MKDEVWICPHELERHDVDIVDLSFSDWYSVRFGYAIINTGLLRNLKLKYEKHILQGKSVKPINKETAFKGIPSSNTDDKGVRSHWCEKINTPDGVFWASCNPFDDECNGGSSIERVGEDEFLWTSTNDVERTELPWLDNLGFDNWVKIKYGKVDALTKEKIWKGCMSKEDPSNEVPNEISEVTDEDTKDSTRNENEECKRVLVEDLLDDKWFKGTESDDDDIEGILDYLELQGEYGFNDPEDEGYEQRRCKLLGILYKRPPPIVAEKYGRKFLQNLEDQD